MSFKSLGLLAVVVFVPLEAAQRGGDHEELAQRLNQVNMQGDRADVQELVQLNMDLAAFIDKTVRLTTVRRVAQLRHYAALVDGMQLPPPYMCRVLCQATCGDGFNRIQAEAATTLKACKDYVNDNLQCGTRLRDFPCHARLAVALAYCADQFVENQAAGADAFRGCSACCGRLNDGDAYHHCDDVFVGVALDTSLPAL